MERCRLWSVDQCFNGEGHFKKPTLFATSPIASKYSALPLTEVSASKVSAIKKNRSIKKRLGGYHIETVLTARLCLSVVSLSDLASFTRSAKAIFPSDYPLIIFNAIILEFGACLTRNGMAQEQP